MPIRTCPSFCKYYGITEFSALARHKVVWHGDLFYSDHRCILQHQLKFSEQLKNKVVAWIHQKISEQMEFHQTEKEISSTEILWMLKNRQTNQWPTCYIQRDPNREHVMLKDPVPHTFTHQAIPTAITDLIQSTSSFLFQLYSYGMHNKMHFQCMKS